jgi:hypothetical protein
MSKQRPRSNCPVCGRSFALCGDGRIRIHDHLQERCPGSGSAGGYSRDISSYFGLTYSNFLVLHRVELEHMPEEWQHQFVTMLDELAAAYEHLDRPEGYEVYPCRWVMVEDLSEADREATGVIVSHSEEATTFYSRDGDELDPQQRVPVPARDPIPHYRHGRVEPVLNATRRNT